MVLKLYNKNATYRWPCVFSLLGHGILLIMLMVSLPAKRFRVEASAVQPASASTSVVHATTVDAAVLQEHIQAIHAETMAKQKQAEQQQRRLQQAEERRLDQIKKEQKKLDQKKQEAEANKKKQQQLASQQKELKVLQDKLLQTLLSKERQQLAVEKKKVAQEKVAQAGVGKVASNQASVVNPGEIEKYRAAILERIQNNWHPPQQNAALSCALLVHLAAGGVVTSVDLVRSSGDAVLDRSAEAAVYKSSPLPVPADPVVFNEFRHFRIKMSPQDINTGINT